MHAHARISKTRKERFFTLKFGLERISHRLGVISNPYFLTIKKPYMVHFQNTQTILRENTRFDRNSESKKEFLTKHPQVNIFLVETFVGLDLRISKFTNRFLFDFD